MTDPYIDPHYKICLSCPLPRCVDESPRCPRRQAEQALSIPDGYVTTKEMMRRLGLSRYQVYAHIRKLRAYVGAKKYRAGGRASRAQWIVPEAGAEWLARYVEENGKK